MRNLRYQETLLPKTQAHIAGVIRVLFEEASTATKYDFDVDDAGITALFIECLVNGVNDDRDANEILNETASRFEPDLSKFAFEETLCAELLNVVNQDRGNGPDASLLELGDAVFNQTYTRIQRWGRLNASFYDGAHGNSSSSPSGSDSDSDSDLNEDDDMGDDDNPPAELDEDSAGLISVSVRILQFLKYQLETEWGCSLPWSVCGLGIYPC
ncbi:hypothetical protein K505DRAFT_333475 [Melanomma pulvis-pyrius CBS 109.77]|uniref:Uncharacterized protein n=1 Tax=Melanomma pulvis-pyrius CBS 109.77 TaxID=1314802 RepID=A0A6A6XQ48_9PLEO|nr:hypothetical protein K505DRAFT_333475 [Melanomma pulvis-pyrius CBS 109.77]